MRWKNVGIVNTNEMRAYCESTSDQTKLVCGLPPHLQFIRDFVFFIDEAMMPKAIA